MRRWIIGLALAGIVGCGGDGGGSGIANVAGTWAGSIGEARVGWVLIQNETRLSGNGAINLTPGEDDVIALEVSGGLDSDEIHLTLIPLGTDDVDAGFFDGTVSGDTMTGVFDGAGFTDESLTLTR